VGFLSENSDAEALASLAAFKKHYGFIPRIFREQLARPDLVASEAKLIEGLLFQKGALTRLQKELILLTVSAANGNVYFTTVHAQTLQFLGVKLEQSAAVTADHRRAGLTEKDVPLLDFAQKLTLQGNKFAAEDVHHLRAEGFSDEQILEAVLTVGLTLLLNTTQFGLGTEPDFRPRVNISAKEVNPTVDPARPMLERPLTAEFVSDDPDLEIISRVKNGDTDAFEELVRRHGRRVYRSLIGILGNAADAEDALQDCFLKAFQHLPEFESRARFSTWLVRIAINTGIQRLRGRKDFDSLDEEVDDFKPRRILAWEENPEDSYSREELKQIVEQEVMKLPVKYRVALMLRDLEELSTEQAANALGLTVPGLKARVLRGRLMLRESMVAYFAKGAAGVKA
jgi:RNA polymerase sigma-70 factor, ECF subfamily